MRSVRVVKDMRKKKGEVVEPSGGENGNPLSLAEVYINCPQAESFINITISHIGRKVKSL